MHLLVANRFNLVIAPAFRQPFAALVQLLSQPYAAKVFLSQVDAIDHIRCCSPSLVLNVVVASFTSWRFARAGFFRWRALWPFVMGAIPMAFIGSAIRLPANVYRPLLGVILLIAAARLLWPKPLITDRWRDPPIAVGILAGAGIGLLSGLTGTGGGIFLSPLLLFLGWSETKTASGVVAVFILCNSASGLLGNLASVGSLPPDLPLLAGAALLGALIGTTLGIKLATPMILKALGLVLIVAGLKMIGVY